MTAEIIAIGSELLGPSRLDTNSLFLTRELHALGIPVVRKTVVGDDAATLAAVIAETVGRTPLVLTTGGLGPTEDDRTREAVAQALGRRLHRDTDMVARLRRYFAERQRPMPEANLHQADRVEGGEWLPNPMGSAAGQWIAVGGSGAARLVVLPGPGEEMRAVFEREVRHRLAAIAPARASFRRVLKIAGLPESEADALVGPLYREMSNPETTILAAGPGLLELHITGWAEHADEARHNVERLARSMEARLGVHVYSRDEATLEDVVGQWLARRGESVAVAESCTGGMLGEHVTRTAGASDYFVGGVICYANALKQKLAGVHRETLAAQGAVSEAVAMEMAMGVRQRCSAAWGLAVTGIAGPGGGTAEKPVGTVCIGLATPEGAGETWLYHLAGGRDRIRRWSTVLALDALRRALLLRLAPPPPTP